MLEPFQTERVDIAGALVASVISNSNRGKNSKPFSLDDFLVVKNSLKAMTDKSISVEQREAAHLKTFVLSMGGRIQ